MSDSTDDVHPSKPERGALSAPARGRLGRALRILVLVAIFASIGRYIAVHLDQLRDAELAIDPARACLSLLFGLGWVMAQSILWRLVLRGFGAHTTLRHAIAQVWLPNLGKYVPGKVWAAVGRVYLCVEDGIPAARATVALFVENVSFILAGAIFAGALLPISGAALTGAAGTGRLLALLAVVIAIGLVIMHPRVWTRAAGFVLKRLGREPIEPDMSYGRALLLVLGYIGSWSILGLGIMTWAQTVAPISIDMALRVAGVYVVAWSAGYLMMLAPAGIGVREGVLMAGLAGSVPPDQVITIALSLRLLFTAIDLLALVVGVASAPALARRLMAMDAAPAR